MNVADTSQATNTVTLLVPPLPDPTNMVHTSSGASSQIHSTVHSLQLMPDRNAAAMSTLAEVDLRASPQFGGSVPISLTSEPAASRLEQLLPGRPGREIGRPVAEEKLDEKAPDISRIAWEKQLLDVGTRMKELHSCLIDEELRLMASLTRRAEGPGGGSMNMKQGL
jgi:hypothetical protein